jgi:hypothetical protein
MLRKEEFSHGLNAARQSRNQTGIYERRNLGASATSISAKR